MNTETKELSELNRFNIIATEIMLLIFIMLLGHAYISLILRWYTGNTVFDLIPYLIGIISVTILLGMLIYVFNEVRKAYRERKPIPVSYLIPFKESSD